MRYNTPAEIYARAGKPHPVTGRRPVVASDPHAENVEVVGVDNFALTGLDLMDGSVGIRLNKCPMFHLSNLSASGMSNWQHADGSWADDGHGIQVINSGGTIHYVWVTGNPNGWAEDWISIYGDEPATEAMHVIVDMCHTYGRSKSPTCTHICIDGPHPPRVTVLQNRGTSARCFLMVAGGYHHDIQMNSSYGAETDCYVTDYYHSQKMDCTTIQRNNFPRGLLLDPGIGSNNRFQEGKQT